MLRFTNGLIVILAVGFTNNFRLDYRKTDLAYVNFPGLLHLPGPGTMYLFQFHPR